MTEALRGERIGSSGAATRGSVGGLGRMSPHAQARPSLAPDTIRHTFAAVSTGGLDERSVQLRRLVLRMCARARRGHIGSAFSCLEIIRVLYDDVLRYDVRDPSWAGRDRFILSKGHGCFALYAVLADKGFLSPRELDFVYELSGRLGGHPGGQVPGVEISTGSLGHGLSVATGMAHALRLSGSDARVFVLLGDGECDEGSVWEAALYAGKHGLANLIAIIDSNKQQAYGSTRVVQDLEPLALKWHAFGFDPYQADGHDVSGLQRLFASLNGASGRPAVIIAHTTKGKGVPAIENDAGWHHKKLGPAEIRFLTEGLKGSIRHA